MLSIAEITQSLSNLSEDEKHGFDYDCQVIPGEVEVLQINIEGREELPIFLSISDEQILCICYLWGENEVNEETRAKMIDSMLDMNIPMPLSSFAKIDDKYVIFGALARNSAIEEIAHELEILSDNALEAITALSEYLV